MKQFLPLLGFIYCLSACLNRVETEEKKVSSPDRIFYDYQVWAEEGREDVTVRLQFRRGGDEGEPVMLNEPSKVLLDGIALSADSTRFMGAYYEVTKPAEEFKGKHTIVFVDDDEKEYRENFIFTPFSLNEELPESFRKRPFQVRLKDFPAAPTTIRLVLTDTSHLSKDINDELTIENGVIDITEQQLANLTGGPITLEIFREEDKPIGGRAKNGGKFVFTYRLRRNFDLVD